VPTGAPREKIYTFFRECIHDENTAILPGKSLLTGVLCTPRLHIDLPLVTMLIQKVIYTW
jgi:hypothetical protein